MKKKFFKNKFQMICYIIIFFICLGLFVYIGNIDFNKEMESDAIKFSALYNKVSPDNVYVFANANEVLNVLDGRTGIILFGFPKNKWTNYYASILNDVALNLNIDKILYYDFLSDREASNGTYETILNKLLAYVPVDDLDHKDILAPTVVVVKDGKVIGYFDDTSLMKGVIKPEDYYNENQIALTYEGFKSALTEYKGE